MPPLMTVDGLVKHFPVRRGVLRRATDMLRAVDGVSFAVESGETLGVVGDPAVASRRWLAWCFA